MDACLIQIHNPNTLTNGARKSGHQACATEAVACPPPAIVMLDSGTIGFRGLASMAGGDLALGVEQFAQMFVVAMTIVVGIMVGYAIVRPEPTL